MKEHVDASNVSEDTGKDSGPSTQDEQISSELKSLFLKRRISLGIKSQLIIIVAFSAIFSLLALAITTGVYFNNTLTGMQATKLKVMAQLKVTQVEQSMQLLYNQVYWVSVRSPIEEALTAIRVGNFSKEVFQGARETLDKSINSTELLNSARLYDLNLNVVASSTNNLARLDESITEQLYVLNQNTSIPPSLYSNPISPVYSGPLSNDSSLEQDGKSAFFMGFTFPVYANTSVVYDTSPLSGFLTMIVNVTSVQSAVAESSAVDSDSSTTFYMVSPIYTDALNQSHSPYMTPQENTLSAWNYVFNARSNPMAFENVNSEYDEGWFHRVLSSPSTSSQRIDKTSTSQSYVHVLGKHSPNIAQPVAAGYAYVMGLSNLNWHVIVEQSWNAFSKPVTKLKTIIAGVVVCTCAVVLFITFGLAVLFVKPITKLQEATEDIARYKKSPEYLETRESEAGLPLDLPAMSTFDQAKRDSLNEKRSLRPSTRRRRNRMSLLSATSHGSGAVASGLRLPGKIPMVSSFFKDELTELTDAFNIMTEELELQYQYLEERVKLRTRELEVSKIEAESANEAKTVFIANISHELRTPLNGILGMTAVAMDEDDSTRTHDSLKLIYRSGELLLHILTELLTYSKNTLNRSKLEPTNFQILEVVYQVKSIFEKLAQDQRVNFNISLQPNVLRKLILFGDSNRIIQIVMNLVSNALKFTPIEGSVNVMFTLLGEYDEEASSQSTDGQVLVKPNQELPTMDGRRGLSSPRAEVIRRRPSALALGHSILEQVSGDLAAPQLRPSMDSRDTLTTERKISISSDKTLGKCSAETGSRENIQVTDSPSSRAPSIDIATLRRPPSLVSSLSTGRLLGENKKYKLRKIYVPKTWVVQIEVSDTGPGIEPALQDRVFEPFIQGDQTLSRSYGGTGLGLSICRQLAAMMKGTLTLKSDLGVGSTFIFTVPLRQTGEIIVNDSELHDFCEDEFNPASRINRKVAFKSTPLASPMILTEDLDDDSISTESEGYFAMCRTSLKATNSISRGSTFYNQSDRSKNVLQSAATLSPMSKTKISLAKATAENSGKSRSLPPSSGKNAQGKAAPRILVAEDNKVNQEVIRRMLLLEGWDNATLAFNGQEAVDKYDESIKTKEYFSIILMDVQMPQLDGLAATRIIRQRNSDIPIIALTAFADESNVKECLGSGMSGFLSKPIKRKDLRNIMSQLCPSMVSIK